MYVAETESGKWRKSVEAPSRSRSLSDGVKKVGSESKRQLTGRRDEAEVEEEVL